MTDQEPIDFSSLDPARDAARWERLVDGTTTRALAKQREASGVLGWSRVAVAASALALAAGIVLLVRSIDRPRARDADAVLLGRDVDVELALRIGGVR